MTFPKYIYLRGCQHGSQYMDPREHFLMDIQQHEWFVYSFLSAVLDAWKQMNDSSTNHAAIQQLHFWKRQLWIEIGSVDSETRPSRQYFLRLLDDLLEWVLYRVNAGSTKEMNVDLLKKTDDYPNHSFPMENENSVSSHSPPQREHKLSSSASMTKDTRKVLNDWFNANIHHPYPSETVKRELAHQAGISVEQVNTFFGNKRMRTKRKLAKLSHHQDKGISSNFSPRFRWQKLIFPQLVNAKTSSRHE
ncbi:hypothetical protein GpartN1_g1157.t1 [Galdieria partita]|uniref:Homeobox domain-containing protein n=1 Tax=Galdieria partita TaxID=83374 RepID=A0A9C7PS08_9RHOD|nr:hypothetical protein GpartN1_g1157.t1 [Galdieria partita]